MLHAIVSVLALLTNANIRLMDFKIKSIDRALLGSEFNISQKLSLLELQDDLVRERYRAIITQELQ